MYASALCTPVESVSVAGPVSIPAGITGLYSASYFPPTATLPAFAWDNGTVSATAAYSWTLPGLYTVTVTATNGCSQVTATLAVSVYCQPVEGVTIEGPGAVLVGQEGAFFATAQPITTSPPLTLTWSNGTMGSSAVYSWTVTGTHSLTVTGVNACGEAVGTGQVRVLVEWPHWVYMPVVWRK